MSRWRSMTVTLKAEKRRVFVALALLAVMGTLWGRLLFKSQPQSAQAQSPVEAAMRSSVPAPAKAPVVIYADLPTTPPRDLFATNYQKFAGVKNQTTTRPKSDPDPDDNQHGLTQVRRLAASLVLQTTIVGQTPQALISGQLLLPGQSINGLTVKEIRERKVVLERDGVQIELGM